QRVTPVVLLQWRDPLGAVGGQVPRRERAALFFQEALHRLRNLATVEGEPPRLCNEAQSLRRRREAEQLAHPRRPAPGQEGLRKAGLAGDFRRGGGPFLLRLLWRRVAPFGDVDRGLQQTGNRQAAKAIRPRHPGRYRTRLGDVLRPP